MLLLDSTFVVVGDLSDGLQVPAFLRDNAVDLVLMDIRMPGIDGIEAARRNSRGNDGRGDSQEARYRAERGMVIPVSLGRSSAAQCCGFGHLIEVSALTPFCPPAVQVRYAGHRNDVAPVSVYIEVAVHGSHRQGCTGHANRPDRISSLSSR